MRFAIDDPGAAYSSLRYVHPLPGDSVKIDRWFVTWIATDAKNAAILRAIIS